MKARCFKEVMGIAGTKPRNFAAAVSSNGEPMTLGFDLLDLEMISVTLQQPEI